LGERYRTRSIVEEDREPLEAVGGGRGVARGKISPTGARKVLAKGAAHGLVVLPPPFRGESPLELPPASRGVGETRGGGWSQSFLEGADLVVEPYRPVDPVAVSSFDEMRKVDTRTGEHDRCLEAPAQMHSEGELPTGPRARDVDAAAMLLEELAGAAVGPRRDESVPPVGLEFERRDDLEQSHDLFRLHARVRVAAEAAIATTRETKASYELEVDRQWH
jgi:hypothetical protein